MLLKRKTNFGNQSHATISNKHRFGTEDLRDEARRVVASRHISCRVTVALLVQFCVAHLPGDSNTDPVFVTRLIFVN
jgi:hypothetical protein